jgi:hypothetical protein
MQVTYSVVLQKNAHTQLERDFARRVQLFPWTSFISGNFCNGRLGDEKKDGQWQDFLKVSCPNWNNDRNPCGVPFKNPQQMVKKELLHLVGAIKAGQIELIHYRQTKSGFINPSHITHNPYFMPLYTCPTGQEAPFKPGPSRANINMPNYANNTINPFYSQPLMGTGAGQGAPFSNGQSSKLNMPITNTQFKPNIIPKMKVPVVSYPDSSSTFFGSSSSQRTTDSRNLLTPPRYHPYNPTYRPIYCSSPNKRK